MKAFGNLPKCASFLATMALLLSIAQSVETSVKEDEAIAIADIWYAMELNSGFTRLGAKERYSRIARISEHKVRYLVSERSLLRKRISVDQEVWAYLVEYQPTGWILVSGYEAIDPIIAFNVESDFIWMDPDIDPLSYFIGHTMALGRAIAKGKPTGTVKKTVHSNWERLRLKLAAREKLQSVTHEFTLKELMNSSTRLPKVKIEREKRPLLLGGYARWDTANWGQRGHYNDTAQSACGGFNVHTGCVSTAMAIKMRFHEWPPVGMTNPTGYWDSVSGGGNYWHQSYIANHTYDWDAMPITCISTANSDISNLIYDCGVSIHMDYEFLTGSGADTGDVRAAMQTYFGYNHGTYKKSTSASTHINRLKNSILAGVPSIVSDDGHTMLSSGYRSGYSDYLWVNNGWGSSSAEAWVNLKNLPGGDHHVDESITYQYPPTYVYVDGSSGGSGTIASPYSNLSSAMSSLPGSPGSNDIRGHLWLKGGLYQSNKDIPITIKKYVEIRSYAGTANIGNRLYINSCTNGDTLYSIASLRINSGGRLIIKK